MNYQLKDGTYTVAAESGDVLYWDMKTKQVVFQEKQQNIQQLFFYKNQTRCIVISRLESSSTSF